MEQQSGLRAKADPGGHDDILERAALWKKDGKNVALATVVSTWGSAPRPVGSMLAICSRASGLRIVSFAMVPPLRGHLPQLVDRAPQPALEPQPPLGGFPHGRLVEAVLTSSLNLRVIHRCVAAIQ